MTRARGRTGRRQIPDGDRSLRHRQEVALASVDLPEPDSHHDAHRFAGVDGEVDALDGWCRLGPRRRARYVKRRSRTSSKLS